VIEDRQAERLPYNGCETRRFFAVVGQAHRLPFEKRNLCFICVYLWLIHCF
jgi:hypothetical protein